MFPLDTRWGRRRDRHRRYDDGSADRGSKAPDLRRLILRPPDQPIRGSTNHAAAVLWFRPCREAFPVGCAPRPGDVGGQAGNGSPLAPGLKYMSAADPEHIALACATQLLLNIANTVDSIASNPLERDRHAYAACDHSRRKL